MSTHERVYRGLLRVYPAAFRERYETEMVQLFADRLRDARAAGTTAGSLRLWVGTVPDLITSALSEYLRRNRTVAHSAAAVPSTSARAFGIAGVLAGIVLVVPYVISLEQGWYPPRIILFNAFVIALAVGLHHRQGAASPRLAAAASVLVIIANAWYLAMIALGMADLNPFGTQFGFLMFLAGLLLWGTAAAYGAAALAIGAFSRWGPMLLVIGSLLALTGIDRLGLASGDSIFGPLSQIGAVLHGFGWILLGAELALRSPTRSAPARKE
jgi:hypothetical protein